MFDGILLYSIHYIFLMLGLGIVRFWSFMMACLCTAPRTPVVMAIKGFTFHPSHFKVFIVGHICCVWF